MRNVARAYMRNFNFNWKFYNISSKEKQSFKTYKWKFKYLIRIMGHEHEHGKWKKKTSFTQHNNKDFHCNNFTKASLPKLEVEEYDELEHKNKKNTML